MCPKIDMERNERIEKLKGGERSKEKIKEIESGRANIAILCVYHTHTHTHTQRERVRVRER